MFFVVSISDVPVFPAIEYPLTWAYLPVPSSTTDSSILIIFSEVSFDTTCLTFVGSTVVTAPVSVLVIDLTILGCINTPSFATAATAVIIWSGVILNLCPKDIVASSTSPTFFKSQK